MGFLHKYFLLLFLLSLIHIPSCFVFSRSIHVHDGQQLQHLEGSRIGETVRGLHKLKRYLSRFGYLDHAHVTAAGAGVEEDHFDDRLESALKLFQRTYNLNVSGVVDSATLDLVATPRCGIPDYVNGSDASVGWVHYPGDRKWHKRSLSWAWLQATLPYPFAQSSLEDAIGKWAQVTGLTFVEYPFEVHKGADIKVGFFRGAHGDGQPFDGPGKVLGHATPPGWSYAHFDEDEKWSVDPSRDSMDLTSVALHELGHTLGLLHSADQNAVMYPSIRYGELKRELTQDDIDGIKALYS